MRGRGRKLGQIGPTCGPPWGQPLGISLPQMPDWKTALMPTGPGSQPSLPRAFLVSKT